MRVWEGDDRGLALMLHSDFQVGRPLDNRLIIFNIFLEGYINSMYGCRFGRWQASGEGVGGCWEVRSWGVKCCHGAYPSDACLYEGFCWDGFASYLHLGELDLARLHQLCNDLDAEIIPTEHDPSNFGTSFDFLGKWSFPHPSVFMFETTFEYSCYLRNNVSKTII